eukprot:CAMPEP_0113935946 /NCGR_PEP_ID=MMETSP1339-20121228/2967_1 /TAXON_ID=94617 /ORGANISM="Fibrocapsa japonica" /LENGTH=226 /DNA_ID=CAMNT_0000938251 /DNA_START=97 /DNA_END=777 /DNA_ORIENTATION=- /assembly_acc=CAM_ASM_000762
MACCLTCFSDDPIEGDKYGHYSNTFQLSMKDATCQEPGCCLASCFCPPCAQYIIRQKALEGDMSNYRCCQGYYDEACLKSGSCGESSCPEVCLCFEATFCNSCAVSSTRRLVMDTYLLQSDPCDRRLIRLNNCIQCLTCPCHILAICDPEFRDCAQPVDYCANCFYYSVAACMTTQVNFEIDYQKAKPIGPEAGYDGVGGVPSPPTAVLVEDQSAPNKPLADSMDR